MQSLNTVKEALSSYASMYRGPTAPALEFSELYDLFPSKPHLADFAPSHAWPEPYPFDQRAGVYIILSETLQVLYVGKASMSSCIGKRLWTYFHYAEGKKCSLKHSTWTEPPRFLMTIAVPQDTPAEAQVLEEYLINQLQPIDNAIGKRR